MEQYSEPASPDFNYGNEYFSDGHRLPIQNSAGSLMNASPPSSAVYNSQCTETSSTSMNSLHRTMSAAHAAAERGAFRYSGRHSSSDDRTPSSPKVQDDVLHLQPDKSLDSQYSEDCNRDTLKIEVVPSKLEPSCFQSTPSNPFRSPPPPMDIASRRKRVQPKPAALIAESLRSSRPSMEPSTASHAEGFLRPTDSPVLTLSLIHI